MDKTVIYYMAPLESVTTWIYRQAHAKIYGRLDKYFIPFLEPHEKRDFKTRELQEILPEHNENIYVVPQILTNRSEGFIKLAKALKDWGYEVVEGKLAIADVMKAGHEGKLEEVFGTGTAAVVTPVKELTWTDDTVQIGDGNIGPLTQKLYDTLTGIQWGRIEDTKGWTVKVQ